MLKNAIRNAPRSPSSLLKNGSISICRSFTTTKRWRDTGSHTAPKAAIDVKAIREDPETHSENCKSRLYSDFSENPAQIIASHERWLSNERAALQVRRRVKELELQIRSSDLDSAKENLLQEVREHKAYLDDWLKVQRGLQEEVAQLAQQLPNLTSPMTPLGDEPATLEIQEPAKELEWHASLRDHVRIGTVLGILDFENAASTSGWGFYFLHEDGERLEHALIQFARKKARERGFKPCSPPSLIYSDIGTACGFRPRDQHGEQQVYAIRQNDRDEETRKPAYSLAGTAEIPFAALHANTVLDHGSLPKRIVGSSRCYRAEAGARGRESRGLYRVHEFSKVEMFAWTLPGQEIQVFDEMVAIQRDIVRSLNLPYRILEMPSHDLGAVAFRKQDIEVFFPSRKNINGGWGEVTSTSICTDYQTRRLNTTVKMPPGSQPNRVFASTLNGTAVAVPRMLAAILENSWESGNTVRIPEALRPYMDGQKCISK